jgi:hypothetical protein
MKWAGRYASCAAWPFRPLHSQVRQAVSYITMGGEDEAQECARRYAAAWTNTKGARSGVADSTPPTGCENRAALTNQVLCEVTQLGLPSTEMLRSLLREGRLKLRASASLPRSRDKAIQTNGATSVGAGNRLWRGGVVKRRCEATRQ